MGKEAGEREPGRPALMLLYSSIHHNKINLMTTDVTK
jgi:hypothetical protein